MKSISSKRTDQNTIEDRTQHPNRKKKKLFIVTIHLNKRDKSATRAD